MTACRRALRLAVALGFLAACAAPSRAWRAAASKESIVRDWMLQDYMSIPLPQVLEAEKERWRQKHLRARESMSDAPVLEKLTCFVSRADSVVERRMVDRVLAELGDDGQAMRAEAAALARAAAPGSDPRWRDLYLRACERRRAMRLRPLLARWRRFVFTQHRFNRGSWKYTEGLSDSPGSRGGFLPGSSLNILELGDGGGTDGLSAGGAAGVYGKVRTLIDDPKGFLRDPDVSYDGRRVLFAWKKSMNDDDLHLYEMDAATQEVRQLTHGLGFADYEGVYLPDGGILFNSTRCFQTVPCNVNPVSNFYLMDGRGRFMRRVGFDQVHTVFPAVTDDGRVLYTRWEYVDRGQIYPQPLFHMNPDGTEQRECYGATSWFPTNIVHARKVPGSTKIVAIVTGHHRPAAGKLGIIDPAKGRQEASGVQLVAPIRRTEPIRKDKYGEGGNQFQHPYPLDERRFLATLALPTPDGDLGRFNIYFACADGRRELLVEGREAGAGIGCKHIVPLAPRPRPHRRPDLPDYRQTTGTVYLQDVYEGPGLKHIPRGTIKRLRVVAIEYQAASIGRLDHRGKGGASTVWTPVAVGHGSWDVKVVLGSARVHDDGSALFEVPARTPIYFQALDSKDRTVQTMRSWTVLMPGEKQSCVGCHEPASTAPLAGRRVSTALAAAPQKLKPFYGPPRGFSFAGEVQPILNRHCTRCHTGAKDKPFSLSGERVEVAKTKRRFSRAYLALTHTRGTDGDWNHPVVNWIDSMSEPSMLPPRHRGAATSKLLTMLEKRHNDVRLSREEMAKIACWIDLLVPYCGEFREHHAWSAAELARYDRFLDKRRAMEATERANIGAWIGWRETASTRRMKEAP